MKKFYFVYVAFTIVLCLFLTIHFASIIGAGMSDSIVVIPNPMIIGDNLNARTCSKQVMFSDQAFVSPDKLILKKNQPIIVQHYSDVPSWSAPFLGKSGIKVERIPQ